MHNKYNKNPDNSQLNFSINKLINALKTLDFIWGIKKNQHKILLKRKNKFLLARKKLFIRARLLRKRRKNQQRLQKLLADNLIHNQNANQLKLPKEQNYSDPIQVKAILHLLHNYL